MMEFLAGLPVFIIIVFFGFFYLKNIYKLFLDIKAETYNIKTIVRGIGVFVFMLGIFMGFIK